MNAYSAADELDAALQECIPTHGSPNFVLFRTKFLDIIRKGNYREIAQRVRKHAEEYQRQRGMIHTSDGDFPDFMRQLMSSPEAKRAFMTHALLMMSITQVEDPLRSLLQDALGVPEDERTGFDNIEDLFRSWGV